MDIGTYVIGYTRQEYGFVIRRVLVPKGKESKIEEILRKIKRTKDYITLKAIGSPTIKYEKKSVRNIVGYVEIGVYGIPYKKNPSYMSFAEKVTENLKKDLESLL